MAGIFDDPRNKPQMTVHPATNHTGMGSMYGNIWTDPMGLGVSNMGPPPLPPVHHRCGEVDYDVQKDQFFIYDRVGKLIPVTQEEAEQIGGITRNIIDPRVRASMVEVALAQAAGRKDRAPIEKIRNRLSDLGITASSLGSYMHAFETQVSKGVFVIAKDGTPLMIIDENPELFPSDAFVTQLRLLKT